MLYRAYYDAFVRSRLIYETGLEEQALSRLRAARERGSRLAMDQAEADSRPGGQRAVAGDLRARVFALAEAFFKASACK